MGDSVPRRVFNSGSACALMLVVGGVGVLGACSGSGGGSSRLSNEDFVEFAAAAGESLRASYQVRERDGESADWLVALTDPVNLSSDVISEAERWSIMERLKGSMPLASLREERNIRFVIPREVADRVEGIESDWQLAMQGREPTHALEATIRSVTRRADEQRADFYAFQMSIVDAASGEVVWSDDLLLKRAAVGRAWD